MKRLTLLFGVILLLLGMLGFVSNPLIGESALFASDALHNIIHAVLGAVLLIAVLFYKEYTEKTLKIVSAILFVIGTIGLLTISYSGGALLGIFYTNGAYNWFHFVAGVVMYAIATYLE